MAAGLVLISAEGLVPSGGLVEGAGPAAAAAPTMSHEIERASSVQIEDDIGSIETELQTVGVQATKVEEARK